MKPTGFDVISLNPQDDIVSYYSPMLSSLTPRNGED